MSPTMQTVLVPSPTATAPVLDQPLVLVIEDSWLYAATFERELERRQMRVVLAHDGVSAKRLVERRRPRVAVVDVNLGADQVDGIALCEELRAIAPETRLIVVTAERQASHVRRALAAGVHGYLLKRDSADPLRCADAVEQALIGDITLDRDAHAALTRLAVEAPDPAAAAGLKTLDVQILRLMQDGQTDDQIARTLFRSTQTIRNRNHDIFNRLGVRNRTAAVTEARRSGILA